MEASASKDAEAAQLLQLLVQLRVSDPVLYQETIKTLGMEELGKALEQQLPDQAQGASPGQTAIETVSQLTEAVSKMREGSDMDLKVGQQPKVKGIHITPEPSFCYKTTCATGKVFINLTSHDAIGPPGVAKKLDANGEEVEGLNVPMSVGPLRAWKDKKGAACSVVDIIVHSSVLEDCKTDQSGRQSNFICLLGIQSIEQKYALSCDRRYKLPKLTYLGDSVQEQFVKDVKTLVQEVPVAGRSPNAGPGRSNPNRGPSVVPIPVPVPSVPDVVPDLTIYWQVGDVRQEHGPAGGEHIEPLAIPPEGCKQLVITGEAPHTVKVTASAFRVLVSCGSAAKYVYLPAAIKPATALYRLLPVPGHVQKKLLEVTLDLDLDPWESGTMGDPGSVAWLHAAALGDGNPYLSTGAEGVRPIDATQTAEDVYAEDKFHIKLPEGVDPYTGVKIEEDVLPEDRFHAKDSISTFLINQREQAKKDKWSKYEKEKAERAHDPNVEYVDMDDFKPGSRYGGKKEEQPEELRKVSQVLVESEVLKSTALSSTLWTELLD